MKRLIILLALFLSLFTGCGLETKTLTQFYKADLRKVTKIVILDGSTGYKKTLEDKKVIDQFLENIKDIKFIPDKKQEARDGFNYSITFYQNGEEPFQFGLTQVNDHYYHTEPDILPIIDDFYKNLDVEEE